MYLGALPGSSTTLCTPPSLHRLGTPPCQAPSPHVRLRHPGAAGYTGQSYLRLPREEEVTLGRVAGSSTRGNRGILVILPARTEESWLFYYCSRNPGITRNAALPH